MIQFLGKWLDPAHILTIGTPYFGECMIEIEIQFMFKDNPTIFRAPIIGGRVPIGPDNDWTELERDWDRQASEFVNSPEYLGLLQIVNQVKNK